MSEVPPRPIRVLLIEHDAAVARCLLGLLAAATDVGFDVERRADLPAGLAELEQTVYDVVLLDLSLPERTGLQAFHDVRAEAPGMPVVLLAPATDDARACAAVQAGAQDVLVEGEITGGSLRRCLRYAIERQRAAASLDGPASTDRVLLVDDDAAVLAAYKRVLRKRAILRTAASAEAALDALEHDGPFAVIIADMYMTGMSGVDLLARARVLAPPVTRILITGDPNLDTAIHAVNRGHIFRFLTKPCPAQELETAVIAGLEQYRFMITYPGDNPNPVMQATRQGDLLYANRASVALLRAWRCDVGRLLPSFLRAVFDDCIRHGVSRDLEFDLAGATFSANVAPIPTTGNLNIYATDVTARKRAEAELAATAKELERSNRDLEAFASVASHDLQEPLRTVTSFARLLEKHAGAVLDDRARSYLERVMDGAQRMRALIQAILGYSRVTGIAADTGPTSAEEALQDAVANIAAVLAKAGTVTHDPLPVVHASRPLLVQLFQNLIGNGLKFRGETPPRVHVSAERVGQEWVFAVADDGIGIAPEHRDRVFAMFQRLHTAGEFPGTGIGLALSRKIVERHGGKIWFESRPGRGTTFFFTLPAAETDSHTVALTTTGAAAPES